MEHEHAASEWEMPGACWQRLASAWRARRIAPRAWRASTQTTEARQTFTSAALEEIRARVRQVTGARPPHASELRPNTADAASEAAPSAPTPPAFLDPALQQHLERFLHLRLPKIQIHTGTAADRLARRSGADAVTARSAIYFRRGAFQPQTREGMGLLAHEATHVAWEQGARPSARQSARLPAQEEQVALSNERRYLAHRESVSLTAPAAVQPRSMASPMAPPVPPPPTLVRTAMASRDLNESADSGSTQGAVLSEAALRVLKADLYRSLLDELRSEFERGA